MVSSRKEFEEAAWAEMLEKAARQVRAKLETAEQGGEPVVA